MPKGRVFSTIYYYYYTSSFCDLRFPYCVVIIGTLVIIAIFLSMHRAQVSKRNYYG